MIEHYFNYTSFFVSVLFHKREGGDERGRDRRGALARGRTLIFNFGAYSKAGLMSGEALIRGFTIFSRYLSYSSFLSLIF